MFGQIIENERVVRWWKRRKERKPRVGGPLAIMKQIKK